MSGDPIAVSIAPSVLHEIAAHALAVFPAECCGWLEGPRGGPLRVRRCDNAQEQGENPAAAERTAETAYVIAGADLLALGRAIDADEPAQVIYHSHPNGRAYFSETDHKVATSPWEDGPAYPVQQLVMGVLEDRAVEAALFAWSDAGAGFVEIARWSELPPR